MCFGSGLSLGLEPSFTPKKFNRLLRETVLIADAKMRLKKLAEFLSSLEEEKRKVEAFKRELPYTMILLDDAIEVMREMEIDFRKLVLDQFIPPGIKTKKDEDRGVKVEKDSRDKMTWMRSAQLWSDNSYNKNKTIDEKKEKEEESDGYKYPGREYSNGGVAFMPSKGLGLLSLSKERKEPVLPSPDLTLLSPGIKTPIAESGAVVTFNSKRNSPSLASSAASVQSNLQPKKQRRCWSSELHTRFINALNELGGPQAATPKQIRELMKVDGLTNDEVKSHLQKFRLHAQRLPATSNKHVVLREMFPPSSPKSPLRLAPNAKRIFGTVSEENDGKSESYIWKGHLQGSSNEETV